jgi:hypothetical protein
MDRMNRVALGSRRITSRHLDAVLTQLGIAGAVLMQVAWFTPWFRHFNTRARSTGELAVLVLLSAAAWLALLAERALRARNVSRLVRGSSLLLLLTVQTGVLMLVFQPEYPGLAWREFLARVLGSLGSVVELIPSELVIILSAMFVFRRGVVAASDDVLAPEKLHFRFRLGIVILAAFGLIFRDVEGRLMLEALPAYFFTGLLALAVSRVDRAPSHAGERTGPAGLRWVGVMVLIILATVGLAQALSAALQSQIASEIVAILASALLGALRIIVILVSPLIRVVSLFLDWAIRAAAGALGGVDGLAGILETIGSLSRTGAAGQGGPPTWIQEHARELAAAGTALVLALLALTAIRGGRRRQIDEESEPVEEVELIPWESDDTERGGGLLAAVVRRHKPPLDALEQMLAAASIRRIYGRLLRKAKSLGRPRPPAETPLEYLTTLRELFPYHKEEVETITRAYLEVQYGGRLDQDAGIAEVRRAWGALQPRTPPWGTRRESRG